MMWWSPYRKRVIADADELMEYYGDQAGNAAARLFQTARRSRSYREAYFYWHVGRYVAKFIDTSQVPYQAEDENVVTLIERAPPSRTLH